MKKEDAKIGARVKVKESAWYKPYHNKVKKVVQGPDREGFIWVEGDHQHLRICFSLGEIEPTGASSGEETRPQNDLYCSCDGPTKINAVLGETFVFCIVCKKERL